MCDRLSTALSADAGDDGEFGDAGADGDEENKLPDDLKNDIMAHLESWKKKWQNISLTLRDMK